MAVEVILPKLGMTMTEGTIVRWFKKEGEEVQRGESLFEVETDKAVLEVEAPASGILGKIVVPEGAKVPVAQVVAIIVEPGEPVPEVEVAPPPPAIEPAPAPERVKASPAARRLARELGIDLSTVVGTGPGGRIVRKDVERAAVEREVAKPAPGVAEVIPLTGVRQLIAERMARSARTVARVTLTTEADATMLVELRQRLREEFGEEAPSYNDFMVKIVAKALREHPHLNATLSEEGIRILEAVNVGVAVDTERGLLVPVIRDADKKSLMEIVRESRELVEKARAKAISPDELSGGTFTITNLGMYEVDAFTPIVNLPECAVLGIGQIVPKPVVREGRVCVRQMMCLSLSFDHRLVDGGPAARFLQRVKQLVEEPCLLFI